MEAVSAPGPVAWTARKSLPPDVGGIGPPGPAARADDVRGGIHRGRAGTDTGRLTELEGRGSILADIPDGAARRDPPPLRTRRLPTRAHSRRISWPALDFGERDLAPHRPQAMRSRARA